MLVKSEIIFAKHGFFTRQGGVSQGEFAALNCGYGSGEDPTLVAINREIVREKIGSSKLVTIKQTHSANAVYVDDEGAYEGDAMVTDKPDITLGILTADCAPILFYDKYAGIIAAAHAGWKGARFGIIESTINLMKEKGATNISAAVGPCIHQNSYEVSSGFQDEFLTESKSNEQFFAAAKRPGHLMFDLPGYIAAKLLAFGATQVEALAEDTLSQPDKFYSFRRGTLQGKAEYGRQISVISL